MAEVEQEEMVVEETILVETVDAEGNGADVDQEAIATVIENADYPVVTTLSDGTVVELVPCEDGDVMQAEFVEEIDDQNLHDAARIILECAENSRLSAISGGSATVPAVVDPTEVATSDIAAADTIAIENGQNEPVKIIRDSANPKKGFCTGCQKVVEYKNRKRHLALVHRIHSVCTTTSKMTKCIHPDCDREFYMVKSMMKHLEEHHGVEVETKELIFGDWDEFLAWKSNEEDTNFVYFSKRNGDCIRGDKTLAYYVCQRDGSTKHHKQKDYIPCGRHYRKGRSRSDLTCPARIKAYRSTNDSSVRVLYTFSHNHSITLRDTIHQPLSKNKLAKIKSKLQQGLNSDKIHALMSFSADSDANDPAHMVSKRRIDGIKKKIDKDSRLCPEESSSVHLLLTKLKEAENSRIVMYISEGVSEKRGNVYAGNLWELGKMFLVLYQTEDQLEMMKKFGGRMLIVDTDGNIDNNRNYLVNILIADEFQMAYPVAHIITNNLPVSFKMCLEKLRERAPELSTLSMVFAPNEPIFFKTFHEVFQGREIRFLTGRWEAVRQWEKRIKQTIFSSTIRRDLCRMLCLLLDELDPNRFEILMEVFVKEFQTKADRFLRFFERHYVYDAQSWAVCYRNFGDYGTEKPEFMKKFLNRLEWWLGERTTSKRIDDLVNLLGRIEREWHARRKFDLEYSSNHPVTTSKHDRSLTIPDDAVQTVKLHGSCIWIVTSELDSEKMFVVKGTQEICEADFCWDRCSDPRCVSLCCHLYCCTCDDGTGLCEHIHKVRWLMHSVSEEKVEVEVLELQEMDGDVLTSIEGDVEGQEVKDQQQQVVEISPDVFDQLQAGTESIVLYMSDNPAEEGESTVVTGEGVEDAGGYQIVKVQCWPDDQQIS